MNPPKVTDEDYINFIIATPRDVTATEAERVQPESKDAPAHDAFTRLLRDLNPMPKRFGQEARTQIDLTSGILVLDDSTLEKPYSQIQRSCLPALVGQTKRSRLWHQFDYFALDGRRALCSGRLSRV